MEAARFWWDGPGTSTGGLTLLVGRLRRDRRRDPLASETQMEMETRDSGAVPYGAGGVGRPELAEAGNRDSRGLTRSRSSD